MKMKNQTSNNVSRVKATLKPRQKKIKKPPKKTKGNPVYGSLSVSTM